jgi:isopenicillin N synthase-like dioxygenase
MEIATQPDTPNRGYFGLEGENLGEKKRGDLKEGLDIGRVFQDEQARAEAAADPTASRFQAGNRWPSAMPRLKSVCDEYFAAMLRLGHQLIDGISLSLGIESSFLQTAVARAQASLRILHYPPQPESSVSSESLGAGPHTDYGALTILAQTSSGLQIRRADGNWIHAPVVPGSFIVNLADCMPRWTNGKYRSTPHRVINLKEERYSIPFFFEVNAYTRGQQVLLYACDVSHR